MRKFEKVEKRTREIGLKVKMSKSEYLFTNNLPSIKIVSVDVPDDGGASILGRRCRVMKGVITMIHVGWNSWKRATDVIFNTRVHVNENVNVYKTKARLAMTYAMKTVSLIQA